ncbi:magnesium-dependent phosphatase-1 [Maribellus comscasis]|uniref:Magnesium-dependent phosphatase-1 n=1 Tax=Maribellus comscasis TaxID=2681766 RepID=A0A6I6K4J0_9BACT|nr:magnesium-dependent phosphatase-1 [Maribellus comscasis]QGY46493.1 magnesium-dependent phosphatase-1 [Maribellus comscasis]
MEVFVFELDFTIWNAGDIWCSETSPPYLWENGKLYDRGGRWIRLYPNAINILEYLKENEKIIAAASRTYQRDWANQLLKLFNIDKYFDVTEVYPGSKEAHFKNILNLTGSNPERVVFFDDEQRNIEQIEKLGVNCVLIENGINLKRIREFID